MEARDRDAGADLARVHLDRARHGGLQRGGRLVLLVDDTSLTLS